MSKYLSLRALRVLCAGVLLAAIVGFTACGGDDDGGNGSAASADSAETTAAEAKDVPFTGSPEEGLPTSYPEPEPEDLEVGALGPTSTTEVLKVIWGAAEAEVERLGGTFKVLHAELNPDTQISQFEQLINEKVDAIILTPIAGPAALRPLLEQAAKANIPVIANLDVSPGEPGPVPGFATQIWHQRDRMVYLQVKAAAERLEEGAEIGLISLALPVPMFQYTAARQTYWAEKFGLKIVEKVDSKNDTTAGGEEAATGLIANHPNLKAILGYNDEPAIGAALAARAAGKPDIETFGITGGSLARTAIENGRLTASVWFDAAALGRLSAQAAYDAAQRTKIPPVVLSGDPYIIDAENVDVPPEAAAKEAAAEGN